MAWLLRSKSGLSTVIARDIDNQGDYEHQHNPEVRATAGSNTNGELNYPRSSRVHSSIMKALGEQPIHQQHGLKEHLTAPPLKLPPSFQQSRSISPSTKQNPILRRLRENDACIHSSDSCKVITKKDRSGQKPRIVYLDESPLPILPPNVHRSLSSQPNYGSTEQHHFHAAQDTTLKQQRHSVDLHSINQVLVPGSCFPSPQLPIVTEVGLQDDKVLLNRTLQLSEMNIANGTSTLYSTVNEINKIVQTATGVSDATQSLSVPDATSLTKDSEGKADVLANESSLRDDRLCDAHNDKAANDNSIAAKNRQKEVGNLTTEQAVIENLKDPVTASVVLEAVSSRQDQDDFKRETGMENDGDEEDPDSVAERDGAISRASSFTSLVSSDASTVSSLSTSPTFRFVDNSSYDYSSESDPSMKQKNLNDAHPVSNRYVEAGIPTLQLPFQQLQVQQCSYGHRHLQQNGHLLASQQIGSCNDRQPHPLESQNFTGSLFQSTVQHVAVCDGCDLHHNTVENQSNSSGRPQLKEDEPSSRVNEATVMGLGRKQHRVVFDDSENRNYPINNLSRRCFNCIILQGELDAALRDLDSAKKSLAHELQKHRISNDFQSFGSRFMPSIAVNDTIEYHHERYTAISGITSMSSPSFSVPPVLVANPTFSNVSRDHDRTMMHTRRSTISDFELHRSEPIKKLHTEDPLRFEIAAESLQCALNKTSIERDSLAIENEKLRSTITDKEVLVESMKDELDAAMLNFTSAQQEHVMAQETKDSIIKERDEMINILRAKLKEATVIVQAEQCKRNEEKKIVRFPISFNRKKR